MTSERREPSDRRKKPTPMLSRYLFRGRRRGGRREGEQTHIYVDRHEPTEYILAAAVFGLSVADFLLTWLHLERGGAEANPVMDAAIQAGGMPLFAFVKLGIALFATAFLLLHARWPHVRRCLIGLTTIYTLLLLWHIVVIVDRNAA